MLAALTVGAVVVACSEQATAPQPRTPPIAANFMNDPDSGNPRIWRYDGGWWGIAWGDGAHSAWHVGYPGTGGMNPDICGPKSPVFEAGQIVMPDQEAC